MNSWKTRNFNQMMQQFICFCMSVMLAIGITFSYGNAAQASTNTTSAATKADANQINQRKENAPHYPNWYNDQRSLESYMDEADVNPRHQGDSPTDQNNDRGYNPIRQDRVNGYYQNQDQSSNLIDRSRDRLQNATENIRETLSPDTASDRNSANYRRSGTSANNIPTDDIKDRAGNRLEQAKEVFQGATERAADGNNPIITGESNR